MKKRKLDSTATTSSLPEVKKFLLFYDSPEIIKASAILFEHFKKNINKDEKIYFSQFCYESLKELEYSSSPALDEHLLKALQPTNTLQITKKEKATKLRSAFQDETRIKATLANLMPNDLVLSTAYDKEDCFFDALAQCLNQIRQTTINTDKYLRNNCYDFYLKNKELVANWIENDSSIEKEDIAQYSAIQYTSTQCKKYYSGYSPIRGRLAVEGRILCRQFNLEAICMIKISEDLKTNQPTINFYLVTKDAYTEIYQEKARAYLDDSDVPIIAMEENSLHYIPFLDKKYTTKNLFKERQSFEQPPVLKLKQSSKNTEMNLFEVQEKIKNILDLMKKEYNVSKFY